MLDNCNDYESTEMINYWRDNGKLGDLDESRFAVDGEDTTTCVMRFDSM
jgi:hypothetical protein